MLVLQPTPFEGTVQHSQAANQPYLTSFIVEQVAIGKQLKQVLDVDERIGFIAHVSCPPFLSPCPLKSSFCAPVVAGLL